MLPSDIAWFSFPQRSCMQCLWCHVIVGWQRRLCDLQDGVQWASDLSRTCSPIQGAEQHLPDWKAGWNQEKDKKWTLRLRQMLGKEGSERGTVGRKLLRGSSRTSATLPWGGPKSLNSQLWYPPHQGSSECVRRCYQQGWGAVPQ